VPTFWKQKEETKIKMFFFGASSMKRCKNARFRETLSALFNDAINSQYYIASAIDE